MTESTSTATTTTPATTSPALPATGATPTGSPLPAGRWELDRAHSSIGFAIRHLGVSKVRGRFSEFDAELVVGTDPSDSTVVASVALASIDTGNADRDDHVRSPELLDVARRPTMTFRSTRVRGHGTEWSLDGELTIGDVTRPLSLAVEFGGAEAFPVDGRRHAGFEATGELRRKDFGLGFGPLGGLLGDTVKVELDLQFVAPDGG